MAVHHFLAYTMLRWLRVVLGFGIGFNSVTTSRVPDLEKAAGLTALDLRVWPGFPWATLCSSLVQGLSHFFLFESFYALFRNSQLMILHRWGNRHTQERAAPIPSQQSHQSEMCPYHSPFCLFHEGSKASFSPCPLSSESQASCQHQNIALAVLSPFCFHSIRFSVSRIFISVYEPDAL